jgi:hypothetical protein
MLRRYQGAERFTVAARDGDLGSVSDLYFDDRSWAVRYLAVEPDPRLPVVDYSSPSYPSGGRTRLPCALA